MGNMEMRLDELARDFALHRGREDGYQALTAERLARLEKKIDQHIQAHEDLTRMLTKSILGAVFSAVGAVVIWGLNLLRHYWSGK